jgi:hypothetical protein
VLVAAALDAGGRVVVVDEAAEADEHAELERLVPSSEGRTVPMTPLVLVHHDAAEGVDVRPVVALRGPLAPRSSRRRPSRGWSARRRCRSRSRSTGRRTGWPQLSFEDAETWCSRPRSRRRWSRCRRRTPRRGRCTRRRRSDRCSRACTRRCSSSDRRRRTPRRPRRRRRRTPGRRRTGRPGTAGPCRSCCSGRTGSPACPRGSRSGAEVVRHSMVSSGPHGQPCVPSGQLLVSSVVSSGAVVEVVSSWCGEDAGSTAAGGVGVVVVASWWWWWRSWRSALAAVVSASRSGRWRGSGYRWWGRPAVVSAEAALGWLARCRRTSRRTRSRRRRAGGRRGGLRRRGMPDMHGGQIAESSVVVDPPRVVCEGCGGGMVRGDARPIRIRVVLRDRVPADPAEAGEPRARADDRTRSDGARAGRAGRRGRCRGGCWCCWPQDRDA